MDSLVKREPCPFDGRTQLQPGDCGGQLRDLLDADSFGVRQTDRRHYMELPLLWIAMVCIVILDRVIGKDYVALLW